MTTEPAPTELAEARLIRCLTAMLNTVPEGNSYILKEAIAALRTARQGDGKLYSKDQVREHFGLPATPASDSEARPPCTCHDHADAICPEHSGKATHASASEVAEPMTGELLPCPFCGKSNQDRWPCEWLDGSGANVVRCAWCHGAAPMSVWNRRHPVRASGEGQQGDLADRITDHLCDEEYDIGGRDELLRHVRAALATQQQARQAVAWADPAELALLRKHSGMLVVATSECEPESRRTTALYTTPQIPDGIVPSGWIERARAAVDFSHNFATAKPNINDTEQTHILGLCRLIQELIAASEASGGESAA